LEDPFNGIAPAKKDNNIDVTQMRSLTDNYVFCPKCGVKNTFKLSKAGKQLNYFCKRCSAKLNNYWAKFQNGQLLLVSCKNCQQQTFESAKYCICCGLTHKSKVVIKPKTEDTEMESDSTLDAYSTYDRSEERVATFVVSKNDYLRWRRLTYTSKKVTVIGVSILNVLLTLGTLFVHLEMSNYLPITFFSCAFICLIAIGAFVVNYEEKMKITKNIDSEKLRKERKPMSMIIIFSLYILTGTIIIWLIVTLVLRYREFIRCD